MQNLFEKRQTRKAVYLKIFKWKREKQNKTIQTDDEVTNDRKSSSANLEKFLPTFGRLTTYSKTKHLFNKVKAQLYTSLQIYEIINNIVYNKYNENLYTSNFGWVI